MTKLPLLSIVTSIYNGGKAVANFLDCISKQTYENIEVIIIDDCSTDKETLNIIKDLETGKLTFNKPYKLIRNTKNLGLMNSFQKGLDNAQGDYFAFPESDDTLDLDFYEILMNEVIKDPAVNVVKGLLLNKYNEKRSFTYIKEDVKEIPDTCIFPDEVLPLTIRNSTGKIISYLMPDVTYCWFYVFDKAILKDNSDVLLYKNAVLYGFNPSPFSLKYKESRISLDNASFYYYDSHPKFEKGGCQIVTGKDIEAKDKLVNKFDYEKNLLQSIFDKYDLAIKSLKDA